MADPISAESLVSEEAEEFSVEIRREQDTTVVVLRGQLGTTLAQSDRDRVIRELEPGVQLVLDFTELKGVSGAGLRRLLQLTRYVHGVGGAVAARGASKELIMVAEASGFLDLFLRAKPTPIPSRHLAPRLRTDRCPTHSYRGFDLRPGEPMPLGATSIPNGINFAIYSRHATECELVLFEPGARDPFVRIPFPREFRVGHVYAMTVFGLDPEEFEYGFSMHGPFEPSDGHRFDRERVLLDPTAKSITGRDEWGERSDERQHPRSRMIAEDFDWEGDRPIEIPFEDLRIYEMHVRGFTRHASSEVRFPGTYAGLREKIPYLVELGVNCVELLPIFEFDETEVDRINPQTGQRLVNYWGYSTLGFYAPKAGYAATGPFQMQADEFKTLVKELHKHGIEVMLDVVFNHTAEGNELGPTLSFRGIDNATYYMLTPDGHYYNFSGCGNTFNCNHPVVRNFVLDSLRYWVSEYHIDGFRFDLASILGRAADGTPLANPPLLEALALDPVLGRTKLIAEAWDAGGLYQVGHFPAYGRWAEWNGKYRDALRKFLKGEMGLVSEMAQRLTGSPDLYYQRGPAASVNFVTCHDGFTLADVVSYNEKHNEANGEQGRDGANDNYSWNCGVEGPTSDPEINALRLRQMKNAMAILYVSQGVPMILMGDEVGRTQNGNNNTYCQDNELSWLDWGLRDKNSELHRFCRMMVAFRKAHPAVRHPHYAGTQPGPDGTLEVTWHGTKAWQADWSGTSRVLAFQSRLQHNSEVDQVYVAMNMYWEALPFEPPPLTDGRSWRQFANTGMESPLDICTPGHEPMIEEDTPLVVGGRSVVILVAR